MAILGTTGGSKDSWNATLDAATNAKNLLSTGAGLLNDLQTTSNASTIKNKNFETIYDTYNNLPNWYKALPYGFIFTPKVGKSVTKYLPIAPNNITITTHFATNVIATLYGTVEQHSDQRYFDIVIEGTTGIAPRYVDIQEVEQDKATTLHKTGRSAFSVQESISSDVLGGFFKKTINTVNQIVNKVADIFTPEQNLSGVNIQGTGYAAFHNLYKFFLYYKRDTSGQTDTTTRKEGLPHPLVFVNYKDNNKYDCSIQKFILRRSAENPMLYNYQIVLKAYNIQKLDANPNAKFDLQTRLSELGLDGVTNSSAFSQIKQLSNDAKQVFGAAVGGLNILGS